MKPVAALLSKGRRLHLQHGPIDLIIGADGEKDGNRAAAFSAAQTRFATVLEELVAELPLLKAQVTRSDPRPEGRIAQRMDAAARPHCDMFVTRMAAVAGAVADTVLEAMLAAAPLSRAYVNNGGDIALHLARGGEFRLAMASEDGNDLGRIRISAGDGIGGIATSGRGGRSLSLGVADSVTVMAKTAAQADVAATLVANAVDLPGHPGIRRRRACELQEDSDLGALPVVTGCATLSPTDIDSALASGRARAQAMIAAGHIRAAFLCLQGRNVVAGALAQNLIIPEREVAYA